MDRNLFDDDESDNEVTFKSNSEYAKKYNVLRRKEELLKLKNKYGDQADTSHIPGETSSSDDDEETTFTEEFERDFFKTLSCLKNKDPRIYNKDVKFFGENAKNDAGPSATKQNKEKPMNIRDYNRKIILDNGGEVSEDEELGDAEDYERSASPTYVQEQKQLRKMFSNAVDEDQKDENDQIGGLFSKKEKTKEEKDEEEKSYREWLSGEVRNLKSNAEENELKPLKDYWSNPSLAEDEAFLRDYFLNQRFKDPSDEPAKIPSYDEIVNQTDEDMSEDERIIGQQTEFEHKFNFRFEEPDQDFIKRYPRTLEHSVRKKSDKRSQKRAEVRDRKAEEKLKKKEEIKQLKALKLKEIQEKIVKLKEITGNDQLAFNDEDIEGDFDPDAHDRRMHELFNEEYYGEEADNKKPEFPELDEELEIDNWDEWGTEELQQPSKSKKQENLHCEDENFNMDCDFDPSQPSSSKVLDDDILDGRRKRRKRKNKLAEALAKKKPIFDPSKTDKTFSQYLDEYYKLDCEDVIGDMPCRFKYREVPPLDYGLTTAEILMADDQELNRWYPLKKTLQYRPEHKQINDHKVLEGKAKNIKLKMKILPSLFKKPAEEEIDDTTVVVPNSTENTEPSKKKRKKKKNKENNVCNVTTELPKDKNDVMSPNKSSKREKVSAVNGEEEQDPKVDGDHNPIKEKDESTENDVPKKKSRKRKKNKDSSELNSTTEGQANSTNLIESMGDVVESPPKKKKKLKDCVDKPPTSQKVHNGDKNNSRKKNKGFGKKSVNINNHQQSNDPMNNLSDERLKAFGLNPKKYRSFMKFKKY